MMSRVVSPKEMVSRPSRSMSIVWGMGPACTPKSSAPHTGRLEQEAVARGEGEGHAVAAAQELHTHRMVEVPVGVECEYGFEAPLGDEVLEGMVFALVHVAGVDDDGLEGVVPHNVGILLYGVEYHSCYLYHCKVFFGRRMTPVIRVKVSNFARDGPTAADKIGFKVPFCAVPAPTWQANLHLLPRRACFCPCLFVSLSQDRESAAVAVRDIFSRGRRVRHEDDCPRKRGSRGHLYVLCGYTTDGVIPIKGQIISI